MTLRDLKEIAQDRNLVLQKRMKKIRMDKYTDTKRQENTHTHTHTLIYVNETLNFFQKITYH